MSTDRGVTTSTNWVKRRHRHYLIQPRTGLPPEVRKWSWISTQRVPPSTQAGIEKLPGFIQWLEPTHTATWVLPVKPTPSMRTELGYVAVFLTAATLGGLLVAWGQS